MGVPPTENSMTATSMGFFRLEEGKMVEAWIEGEFLGMMQQLGMELKPKEGGR